MFSKIFCIITLIAISSLAYGTESQKIQVSALKFVQLQTNYVIDDALQLLEGFQKGINDQVDNIQGSMLETVKSLSERIDSINVVKAEKQKNCSVHYTEKQQLDTELAKVNNYIDWIQKRIQKDEKDIIEIQDRRCMTHEVFIKYVMDAKLMLRLIVFLRAAIDKYSFAQMRQVNDILSKYMTQGLISNHEALKLMFAELGIIDYKQINEVTEKERIEKQRTSEEIGTQHVDQGGEQITVQGFKSTSRQNLEDLKAELIGLCNQLEDLIKGQMSSRQDDEIDLNDQIVRYLTLLDAEILQLQRQLIDEQAQQEGVLFQIEGKLHLIEWCDGEIALLNSEIKKTEDFITEYQKDQIAYKEQLNNQITIIEEIKTIYLQHIQSVAEEFKGRTDDYIYTASFNGTATFDERQLQKDYADKANEETFSLRIEDLTAKSFEK